MQRRVPVGGDLHTASRSPAAVEGYERAPAGRQEPMARIEDYAVIGDTQSVALVCRNGSIDWLCLPRFDSPACFAALLGEARHGYWRIAPVDDDVSIERHYRDD